MFRSQKLLLRPTKEQERLFRGSAGLSRFAWNWAVAYLRKHYGIFGRGSDGKTRKGYKAPSAFTLTNRWNALKDRRFPWVREYSKIIPEDSFDAVQKAYKAAFARLKRTGKWSPPKFHKKGVKESFAVFTGDPKSFSRKGQRFNLPRVGYVKTLTTLRWPDANRRAARVKLVAGRWWLTISYELPDPKKLSPRRPACGIDLGCTTFATVASKGVIVEEIAAPKPYAKAKRKLRRLQRRLSRRKKGSRHREEAKQRVAKTHQQIANIRDNFLHQLTCRLVRDHGRIVIEDLPIAGLTRGWLSGTIHDFGFYEFRHRIEYKAEAVGTEVVFADRFYPSSKTCFRCKAVKAELPLSERTFFCEQCGHTDGRDANAAKNLELIGRGSPESTRGESGGSSARKSRGAARRTANTKRPLSVGDA